MSIADLVDSVVRPTISFEMMPPRNPDAAPKFWENARQLVAARPDFISVTYGAAGTDRETTRNVVTRLAAQTPVLPIAHLTCVGATRGHVAEVIDEFLGAGVRSFLALRGDPPRDQPDWQPPADGVHSSDELIHLLREVEAQRCSHHPALALRGAARPLTVAVATFPNGNVAAGTTPQQEAVRLWEKQQAGADFAITQLFYDADSYNTFVDTAREAGVTIPILAGILPMTDPKRLRRVEELTGVAAPAALVRDLDRLDSATARHDLGIRATIDVVDEVLQAGAPGLHVYTFNKYEPALDLLEGVNLGGSSVKPAQPDFAEPDLASGPWVNATDQLQQLDPTTPAEELAK